MKMRFFLLLVLGATVFCSPFAARGQTSATLAWNAVTDPRVTGYILYWGTNSGNYVYSNICTSAQTSVTVSNLWPNMVYYFAVKSVSANGLSDFSSETFFTNDPNNSNQVWGADSQSSGGNGNNNGSSGNNSSFSALSLQETNIVGIPPILSLVSTNGHLALRILGTMGASLTIQSTTNFASSHSWTVLATNVTPTNAPTLNPPLGPLPAALAAAFVPASQTFDLDPANPAPAQFYRTMMSCDYLILADTVLASKGYGARLIVVNMPGYVDDVCYETLDNNLIFYDNQTYGFGVEPSSSTIRQIATTFSSSLSLNWTSASEFVYSNGMSVALATVVETEDPSTDPVAGQAGAASPIVIDF